MRENREYRRSLHDYFGCPLRPAACSSGIQFLARRALCTNGNRGGVEQAATGVPLIYTYILDPATRAYRTGEMYTGIIKATAPFTVDIDLSDI